MSTSTPHSRRDFLFQSGIALAAASAAGATRLFGQEKPSKQEAEVAPAEDLMREHGLLKRVLIIYGEAIRRLEASEELPPDPLKDSARVIREFIEDYHEKLEEDHLFPRFRKAGKLVDLVEVLLQQHQAGRKLTDTTLALLQNGMPPEASNRRKLADSLHRFIRMYAPHEAREDTVLFPGLHQIISTSEYLEMGEAFEQKERELFGENGFERMVDKVAGIEKKLGLYDLAQFTPKI